MAALSLGLFGSLCLSGEMKLPGDMKPKSRRSRASRLEQELERELKVDRETKITPLSAIREALRDPEMTVTETSPIHELHKWEVKWKPSGLFGLIHEEPINFLVFLEDGHIAQIRATFDPEPLSPARQMMVANKWNREKRFTKAFMNDNEDSMARSAEQARQIATLGAEEPAQAVRRLQGEVAMLETKVLEQQAMQSAAARKSEIALRAELDVKNHEVSSLKRALEARDSEVCRYEAELSAIIAELNVLREQP
eukprot:symbB.v1.2.017281.t2/scaffold1325.1/size176917/7